MDKQARRVDEVLLGSTGDTHHVSVLSVFEVGLRVKPDMSHYALVIFLLFDE